MSRGTRAPVGRAGRGPSGPAGRGPRNRGVGCPLSVAVPIAVLALIAAPFLAAGI